MRRTGRLGLAAVLVLVLIGGVVAAVRLPAGWSRTSVTAYFENSTGIYPGDQVRILGVPVGEIESVEPQPDAAKVTFWVDSRYRVPADAQAVIISPTVVAARFIQLTPVYAAGPELSSGSVIPLERTVVPVEWDDLRAQLQKLTAMMQPDQPGGVSSLGAFVDTGAANLRGQGTSIRDSVIKLSETLSTLGDQSPHLFGSVRNLATLVSGLQASTDVMRQLNGNLAAVTGLIADDPEEVGRAVADMNIAVADMRSFLAEHHDSIGTTSDKLAEITQALGESSADVKQVLHVAPNAISNFINTYQPAQAVNAGALAGNNFSNPLSFICGAVQAASRLGAEQSAKLCAQYLAPIVKNRQYNFLGPLGISGAPLLPFLPVGAQARPNEVTFSEEWMRPDYVPPAVESSVPGPLAAEATSGPAGGLEAMMVPAGAGS